MVHKFYVLKISDDRLHRQIKGTARAGRPKQTELDENLMRNIFNY